MAHIYPAIMGVSSVEMKKFDLLEQVADRIHIDIIEDLFFSGINDKIHFLYHSYQKKNFFIWVHLMVDHPVEFYNKMVLPEGSLVSFHIESKAVFSSLIKTIREKKHLLGLVVNPKTPLQDAFSVLHLADQVSLMSVEPGFSGQCFLPEVIKKLESLFDYRKENKLNFRIAMDGGINQTNIEFLMKKGVDDYAVSSGIFMQDNPIESLNGLYAQVDQCDKGALASLY